MKNKTKLEPKVTARIKLRSIYLYAGVGIAVICVGVCVFTYLNVGNSRDSYAQNQTYSSVISGDWSNTGTWGGTVPTEPLNQDVVNINASHDITRTGDVTVNNGSTFNIDSTGQLTIIGDLIVNNNLTLNVDGTLIITGNLQTNNGATLTVSGGGAVDISGDASFENNATLEVDGTLTIDGTLTMGEGYSFTGEGIAIIGGGCSPYWDGVQGGTCNTNSPLPVELLSFLAKVENDGVAITWQTATELNNDYFTIERSENGTEYTTIAEIDGNGTVNSISSYEFTDHKPLNGLSYYRLLQTDFDGTTETFRPVSINMETANKQNFTIYPNPLSGNILTVKADSPQEGDIEVFDQSGKKVFSGKLNSFGTKELILPSGLLSGIYFVNISTASLQQSIKLVKK